MFGKKNHLSDLMQGFHDIHCHLLPGVDDGSKSMEYSQQLLSRFEKLGVKGIYTTPHIINGMYDSRGEDFMRERFSEFKNNTDIDVRLAAEYFIDDKFLDHLAGQPLTFADNHVLAEFSMNSYAMNSFDLLFDASVSGYNIILAHPERYTFIQHDPKGQVMQDIINCGYKLQLNMLSLAGYHGKAAQKLANYFLSEGMYTFIGTDTHSQIYLDTLEAASVSAKVYKELERLKENNEMLF